jgi:uracil-DNA glycosylase family 4
MSWEDEYNLYTCPHCKTEDLVLPVGNPVSPILIIGEFPGKDEIKQGRPLVGAIGAIVHQEFLYLGCDIRQWRITNLWLHKPNDDKYCFEFCAQKAIAEAKDRKAILLLGSSSVDYFCDMKVSEVAGLKVKSPYLSCPLIMACSHPSFASGIGEFRLSAKKFVKEIEGLL